MKRTRTWWALLALGAACGDDDDNRSDTMRDAAVTVPGVDAGAGGTVTDPSTAALTYWQDMVPIFERHCLQCHQQGGIAPFRLDDYAEVKKRAAVIAHSTKTRDMPPWDVTSNGSCGTFQHSLALSDEQIQRVSAWAEAGAAEGTPTTVRVPALDALTDAKEYPTPEYVPAIQGGVLAEADDYRCFLLEPNLTEQSFITGYDVLPGTDEIVHHVVVSIVDPDAPAELPAPMGTTNRQVMEQLDAESPERLGWPCFGLAGDGVAVSSVPVVWAPGQGVVRFPNESGVPLSPKHKLVVQMHYNLADPAHRGRSDATKVRLSLASKVTNVGVFSLIDPLLDSLYEPQPDTLEPGKASVLYTWKRGMKEVGLDELPGIELWGVMPHMHERGHKYQMRLKSSASAAMQCAADVQRWDFHWQRMYFYEKPWTLTADSEFEVTCDFDTSDATSPVTPGWGTRNEMCLATLYLTVPAAAAGF
jgi:hypothetical protein